VGHHSTVFSASEVPTTWFHCAVRASSSVFKIEQSRSLASLLVCPCSCPGKFNFSLFNSFLLCRFQTEPLSEGLNIAQEAAQTDQSKVTNFKRFFSELNGTTNTSLALNPIQEPKASSSAPTSEFSQPSRLGSAVVKELKCDGGTYMAIMSPLQLSTSY
jgi:hypothetical protein